MPTWNSYVYNTATVGLTYTGPGITWTIGLDGFVGSHDSIGVYGSYGGSKLINKGQIFSDHSTGAELLGNDNSIVNRETGSIFAYDGIYIVGINPTITNHGSIKCFDLYGIDLYNTSNGAVYNDGEIYGHENGVILYSDLGRTPATIDNAGLIRSEMNGILVDTNSADPATIINEPGGTIKGGVWSILASEGMLSLENHGTIKGSIDCTSAASPDKIVNDGAIKGEVQLGPGDDVFRNNGGTAGRVFGGDGNDKLFTGPGADKFVFDTTLNAATNVDRVHHFDPGTDRMFLDQTVFTNLTGPGTLVSGEFHKGHHAADGDDYIIYNPDTGSLYYDPDGNGSAHKVQFAQLDTGLHLHADSFTVIA